MQAVTNPATVIQGIIYFGKECKYLNAPTSPLALLSHSLRQKLNKSSFNEIFYLIKFDISFLSILKVETSCELVKLCQFSRKCIYKTLFLTLLFLEIYRNLIHTHVYLYFSWNLYHKTDQATNHQSFLIFKHNIYQKVICIRQQTGF